MEHQSTFREQSMEENFDFVFGHQEPWSSTDSVLHFDCTDIASTATTFDPYFRNQDYISTPYPTKSQYPSPQSHYTFGHTSPNCEDLWESNTSHSSDPPTPRSRAQSLVSMEDNCNNAFASDIYTRPMKVIPCYNYHSPKALSRASSVHSTLTDGSWAPAPDYGSVRRSRATVVEMEQWGVQHSDGSWTCSFEACTSRTRFYRSCDLRKHHKRHERVFFCRNPECPQSRDGGFATRKDRLRHEARHNPSIECEWAGCGRVFSRNDNMVSDFDSGEKRSDCANAAAEGSRQKSSFAMQMTPVGRYPCTVRLTSEQAEKYHKLSMADRCVDGLDTLFDIRKRIMYPTAKLQLLFYAGATRRASGRIYDSVDRGRPSKIG